MPDGRVVNRRLYAQRLEQRLVTQQPPRFHCRPAAGPYRPGQEDLRRQSALHEIVRLQPDPPVRRRQTERVPHRPAHPRVGLGFGGPGVLVQPAENDAVDALQARLQRSPNEETRMTAVAGAHHAPGHRRRENCRIVIGVDRGKGAIPCGVGEFEKELRRCFARVARPEPVGPALAVAFRQRLGSRRVGNGKIVQPDPAPAHELQKRIEADAHTRQPIANPFVLGAAQNALQPGKPRRRPRAAQSRPFQPANGGPEIPRCHPAGGERMLERCQQFDRCQLCRRGVRERRKKGSRRGLGQRHTGGIVDVDRPAPQFRGHPAGQIAVGRHQGRCLVGHLHGLAQDQRDDRRLFLLVFAIDARDRAHRQDRAFLGDAGGPPFVERPAGPQRLGKQFRPRLDPAHRLGGDGPVGDAVPFEAEPAKQIGQGVLRVDRRQLLPGFVVEMTVETRQDDLTLRQVGDDMQQLGRRRHGTGGSRSNDRRGGRIVAPLIRLCRQQPVSPLRRIDVAAFRQDIGPRGQENIEKPHHLLPMFREIFRREIAQPHQPEAFCLNLVEETGQCIGQHRRLVGRQIVAPDQNQPGEKKSPRQFGDSRRQIERRARHRPFEHQRLFVEIADRQHTRKDQRGPAARAQERVGQRPDGPARRQQDRGIGKRAGHAAGAVEQSPRQRVDETVPRGHGEHAGTGHDSSASAASTAAKASGVPT